MNRAAIDRVFCSDDVAAKYQVICTHEHARTVIDAAHDESSGSGSMAVVDDTRGFGGHPILPAPGARHVELGPLVCGRRVGNDERSKRYSNALPHGAPAGLGKVSYRPKSGL